MEAISVRTLEERIEQIIYPRYIVKESIDGLGHVRHVVFFGQLIALIECPDNVLTVVLGCALHDIGRFPKEHPEGNQTHGDRGAVMARDILEAHFIGHDIKTICDAVADHNKGMVTDNPLIGAIWDADRLDLFRLHEVRANLLSTRTAQDLLPYARGFVKTHFADYGDAE